MRSPHPGDWVRVGKGKWHRASLVHDQVYVTTRCGIVFGSLKKYDDVTRQYELGLTGSRPPVNSRQRCW